MALYNLIGRRWRHDVIDAVPLLAENCLIWNKALPSEQTKTVTHKSCNIITDNSCIACPCWYPFWYICISPPLPYHLLPCMHPLPFPPPPLGWPTLFYPPFPYSHYPSSPIHYYRIPPLNSAPLRSTLLPSPTQPSHIPYPSLAPLPSAALSYPLASSTIPYPLLILHSPTLTKATLPYPPFLQLPSPTLSYPLISSHHSLLSPNPLTWRTLPCHLPSLIPPISSPFSPPLGYPFLPSRPYPTILSHFLPFPRTPSAPLPYLSSHLLPSPILPTLVFRSTHISSSLVSYSALPSHPLPYISSTLPYPSGRSRGRKVSFPTLL